MSNRTPTPNVMDALLGGGAPASPQPATAKSWNKPAKEALEKPVEVSEPPKNKKNEGTGAKATEKRQKAKTKPTRVTPVSRQKSTNKGSLAALKTQTASMDGAGGQDKATFSMSQQTLDRLEQIWFDLRRGVYGPRVRCSKSEIAEIALKAVLDDFEMNGLESPVAEAIVAGQGQ